MNSYSPDRVINGTFGEVWVDNDYMAVLQRIGSTHLTPILQKVEQRLHMKARRYIK